MVQENTDVPAFGRRKRPPESTQACAATPAPTPLDRHPSGEPDGAPAIAFPERKTGDERLSNEIIEVITAAYRDPKGVHAESLLTALGAVAGFAAQNAVWSLYVRSGKMGITSAFKVFEANSGQHYFFGDLLKMIVGSTVPGRLSIWQLVAGGARKAGAEELPDIDYIFANASATVGEPRFGVPNLPTGHAPYEQPRDALNRFWPQVKAILVSHRIEEGFWPLEIAVAAQRVIVRAKDAIDPLKAALIVMEAAVPMSAIDPLTVPEGK